MKATKKKRHINGSDIEKLKAYLTRIEVLREYNLLSLQPQPNWIAIQQAKEISAWLSIFEHGNAEERPYAEHLLLQFFQ